MKFRLFLLTTVFVALLIFSVDSGTCASIGRRTIGALGNSDPDRTLNETPVPQGLVIMYDPVSNRLRLNWQYAGNGTYTIYGSDQPDILGVTLGLVRNATEWTDTALINRPSICFYSVTFTPADTSQQHPPLQTYRKVITVDSTYYFGDTLFGQQIIVTFAAPDHDLFSHAKPDGADLRFYKTDMTPLSFHIQRWDPAHLTGTVCVKLDTIFDARRCSLYCDYGNPNAVSASNGPFTYDYFEDFEVPFDASPTTSLRDSLNDFTQLICADTGKWAIKCGTSTPSQWDYAIREQSNILYTPSLPESLRYRIWYSGSDTSGYQVWNLAHPNVDSVYNMGIAYSADGIAWKKYPGNPVFGPGVGVGVGVQDPYMVQIADTLFMFGEHCAGPAHGGNHGVQGAWSLDNGFTWTWMGRVFDTQNGGNPPGWESTLCESPIVWLESDTLFMLHEGSSMHTGLAWSVNHGRSWIRYTVGGISMPVFSASSSNWDNISVVGDDITKIGNTYWFTYHGERNDPSGYGYTTALARSTDRIHWREEPRPVDYYFPVTMWSLDGPNQFTLSTPSSSQIGGLARLVPKRYDPTRFLSLDWKIGRNGYREKYADSPPFTDTVFALPLISSDGHCLSLAGQPSFYSSGYLQSKFTVTNGFAVGFRKKNVRYIDSIYTDLSFGSNVLVPASTWFRGWNHTAAGESYTFSNLNGQTGRCEIRVQPMNGVDVPKLSFAGNPAWIDSFSNQECWYSQPARTNGRTYLGWNINDTCRLPVWNALYDTTFKSTNKYITFSQGESDDPRDQSEGQGGTTLYDWVYVRKCYMPAPAVTISTEIVIGPIYAAKTFSGPNQLVDTRVSWSDDQSTDSLNYGGTTSNLTLGWEYAAGHDYGHRLLFFVDSLAGYLQPGSMIESAVCSTYFENCLDTLTLIAYTVDSDWVAGTADHAYQAGAVCWQSTGSGLNAGVNHQTIDVNTLWNGGMFSTPQDTITVAGGVSGWYAFDVTQALRSEWNGIGFGFIILDAVHENPTANQSVHYHPVGSSPPELQPRVFVRWSH